MALAEDLEAEVRTIFKDAWDVASGRVVPNATAIGPGNKAIEFDSATVLYADIVGSTAMVDSKKWQFCGKVFKTYLLCAAKIIKSQDGVIIGSEGDRITAVFIGERRNSRAAKSALKLNGAVKHIINPVIAAHYPDSSFAVRHVVGIDASSLRIIRSGVNSDDDLVWIGRAASYAAKLTSMSSDKPIRITADVFSTLSSDLKQQDGKQVWEPRAWSAMNDMTIYGSGWSLSV